ncbi:MAG: hypothetical protein M0Z41_10025 [Peptococcaceae bacterium]|nr:hypothetical protein [Peptococcaceae bacterium]
MVDTVVQTKRYVDIGFVLMVLRESAVCTSDFFDISGEKGRVRPGSTGRPLPGYEVRIPDEGGKQVPPGGTGTLRVKGDSITPYFRNKHILLLMPGRPCSISPRRHPVAYRRRIIPFMRYFSKIFRLLKEVAGTADMNRGRPYPHPLA